jgi:hypothetical protein
MEDEPHDVDRGPSDRLAEVLAIVSTVIGLFAFLLAAAAAAGHSRMPYDSGRAVGFMCGVILCAIAIRLPRKAVWRSLAAGVPAIRYLYLFIFVTYKDIPFYQMSGLLEIPSYLFR